MKQNKRLIWIWLIIVAIILVVPSWFYIAPRTSTQKRGFVDLVVKIVGGIVVFSGAYYTWKRVEISREGQITERFTRAVDQLGACHENGERKREVRIGGIYALERIANDSAHDHWQIMEILTAYVRENAYLPREPKYPEADYEGEDRKPKESEEPFRAQNERETPTDIQAALAVLGRRKRSDEEGEHQHLNLSKTNLRRAYLRGAKLQRAYLRKANLQEATLLRAKLQKAYLVEANLADADLTEANLEGAHLMGVNFEGANLRVADLRGTKGLTVEQLSQTKTLYKATLEEELRKQIEKNCPDLLEESQSDE